MDLRQKGLYLAPLLPRSHKETVQTALAFWAQSSWPAMIRKLNSNKEQVDVGQSHSDSSQITSGALRSVVKLSHYTIPAQRA